jgi:16S rRNA (cytidine1402-2'-O)-methyltransferase
MPSGTLYIVATPIGNLEDITVRALRILKEVDLIACEDTRHTRKLLDHYGVRTRTVSYHEHNEYERSAELVERLRAGESVALVSDAGTPLISDPGFRLVTQALAGGVPVVPVPGASAILSAVAAAGLPTDCFYFGGFLPAKASHRRRALEDVKALGCTLVFYEAPHRIGEALADIAEVLGERELVLAREITKIHEEFLRGTASKVLEQVLSRPVARGEMTIVIGKPAPVQPQDGRPITEAVDELIARGMTTMEAIKTVARERGLAKREVYAEYERRGGPRLD